MPTPWKVPRDWAGDTAVIFASGPTMTQEIADGFKPKKVRCIVVNDQFRYAPWADVLYAADWQWWTHPKNFDIRQFKGQKVTVSFWPLIGDDVMFLNPGQESGLSDRDDTLNTCRNSGFQAMNLAALRGATTLVLCGFDYKKVDGKSHNFGDHPEGLSNASEYSDMVRLVTKSAPDFAARGIQVINCSRKSALKCFPYEPVENVLARIPTNP